MTNTQKKMRSIDKPYEVWGTPDLTVEIRVVKKYQTPENERKNPYARWMCATGSPENYYSFTPRDAFVTDIRGQFVKLYDEREDGDFREWYQRQGAPNK